MICPLLCFLPLRSFTIEKYTMLIRTTRVIPEFELEYFLVLKTNSKRLFAFSVVTTSHIQNSIKKQSTSVYTNTSTLKGVILEM